MTTILGPIPALLILLGNAITPGKGFSEGPFSTETELRELVDLAEASAVIESGERRMIHSVFELGDTTTREVMVPRPDVVYVERHKNIRQTLSLFLRSGYSRIPVVDENLDDIVGMAYLKDLVRRDFEAPDVEFTQRVDEVMRPVHYVPESKPVDALLSELQARRQHIAVVVDEYGGTAGLVTIEDVLEEIVGEITDEYDAEEVEVEHLDDGAIRLSLALPGRRPRRAGRLHGRGRGRRQRRRAHGQAPRQGADPRLGRGVPRPAAGGRARHRAPQQDRDRAGDGARRRRRRRRRRGSGQLRRPLTTTYSQRIRPEPSSASAASASRAASSAAIRSGWSARPR